MKASYLMSAVALVSTAAAGFAEPPGADATVRPEAARVFPGYVQPVLMNLCAKCHCRPDHPSGFKLSRIGEGYTSPQATAQNLRATIAFVNPADPTASPLLTKALAPHGGSKDAPFANPQHPAYRNLAAWAAAALPPVPGPQPVIQQAAMFVPAPAPAVPPAPADAPVLPPVTTPPTVPPAPAPIGKPNPDDPFDPGQFNR